MCNISNHQSYNTLRVKKLYKKQITGTSIYWNNKKIMGLVYAEYIYYIFLPLLTAIKLILNVIQIKLMLQTRKLKQWTPSMFYLLNISLAAIILGILANIATVTSRSNKLITNRFEHLSRDNVAEVTVLSLVALSLDRFFVLFKTNLRINSKHKLSIGICIFIVCINYSQPYHYYINYIPGIGYHNRISHLPGKEHRKYSEIKKK